MAKRKNELFSSILYIVIGILLAVFPGDALKWAMTIVGVLFIVTGALELIKKNWVGGAVSLVIGIVVLVLGLKLTGIVLLVLGILIAVKGIVALIEALKKADKNALELVFPILTIVFGGLLAFGNVLGWITIVAGILLAIDGGLGLWGAIKAMSKK